MDTHPIYVSSERSFGKSDGQAVQYGGPGHPKQKLSNKSPLSLLFNRLLSCLDKSVFFDPKTVHFQLDPELTSNSYFSDCQKLFSSIIFFFRWFAFMLQSISHLFAWDRSLSSFLRCTHLAVYSCHFKMFNSTLFRISLSYFQDESGRNFNNNSYKNTIRT